MTGSGHFFSVNPDDLSSMIYNVRLTELVQGNHEFRVEEVEQAARSNARRSLVASQAISKGTSITSKMIGVKRPADGLSPNRIDEVLGKKTERDIAKDELISLDFLSS